MQFKNGTFAGMAKEILKSNSKIVIFGTGVIGMTIMPEILADNEILSLVDCYIDNDKTRWESEVNLGGRIVKIHMPEYLNTILGNVTILIATSRYAGVFEQLQSMKCTEKMSCFFIPMMCISNFSEVNNKGVIKTSDKRLIPKVIHYMWLGGKPIPDALNRCIESWKENCPDYEIIRWDESNYDVHKNTFMSEAYDNGKYGFVPDFARLDILYTYGGIYMDTDVEILRNIDDLLYQEAFCGVEKWQVLNFGACSGAVAGHDSLKPFLDSWSKRKLLRKDGTIDGISSGLIDTSIALKSGYKVNGKNQNIAGMNIYSYDYFNPYDYMSGNINKTNNTFSIHHFNNGWLDEKSKENAYSAIQQYKKLEESANWIG